MKRFLMALLKLENLIYLILGIAGIVIGSKMVSTFDVSDMNSGWGSLIGGGLIFLFGGAFIVEIFVNTKRRMHAICCSCQKYMGKVNGTIYYEYVCNSYKVKTDKDGKHVGTYFYYTVTCRCPHCNTTNTWDNKVFAKNEAKANVIVDRDIKRLLKIKR